VLQQELTAKGSHAVIVFESNKEKTEVACETTRRATVTILAHSVYDTLRGLITTSLPSKISHYQTLFGNTS